VQGAAPQNQIQTAFTGGIKIETTGWSQRGKMQKTPRKNGATVQSIKCTDRKNETTLQVDDETTYQIDAASNWGISLQGGCHENEIDIATPRAQNSTLSRRQSKWLTVNNAQNRRPQARFARSHSSHGVLSPAQPAHPPQYPLCPSPLQAPVARHAPVLGI
jgi:hypothetical protein